MLLTREQILAADDLSIEDVPVPEWGGIVRVRGLTGAERDGLEAETVSLQGRTPHMKMENFRARLVARSMVDDAGKRLFTLRDVEALGQKSAVALQRVFEVAQRLSGLSAGDVEELVKNYVSDQDEDSSSA